MKKEIADKYNFNCLNLLDDSFLPMEIKSEESYEGVGAEFNNRIIKVCIDAIKEKSFILFANVQMKNFFVPYTLGFYRFKDIEKSYQELLNLIEDGVVQNIVSLTAVTNAGVIMFMNVEDISEKSFIELLDKKIPSFMIFTYKDIEFYVTCVSIYGKVVSINEFDSFKKDDFEVVEIIERKNTESIFLTKTELEKVLSYKIEDRTFLLTLRNEEKDDWIEIEIMPKQGVTTAEELDYLKFYCTELGSYNK